MGAAGWSEARELLSPTIRGLYQCHQNSKLRLGPYETSASIVVIICRCRTFLDMRMRLGLEEQWGLLGEAESCRCFRPHHIQRRHP